MAVNSAFREDINRWMERFEKEKNAVLLDVRTPREYAAGHIPGSRNIPLQELEWAEDVLPARDTPLYVYCLSGMRSHQAAIYLEEMGYGQIINIGGFSEYRGKIEGCSGN